MDKNKPTPSQWENSWIPENWNLQVDNFSPEKTKATDENTKLKKIYSMAQQRALKALENL